MALGKSLGNILENYFGEETLNAQPQSIEGEAMLNITPTSAFDTPPAPRVKTHTVQLAHDSNNQDQTLLGLMQISINDIAVANPFQTREYFDQEKIQTLAEDIRKNGLIQPIVVLRKKSEDGKNYILLVGERRLRACKYLELDKITAIVKSEEELNEGQQSIITAMENLQREDLSPLEMAKTFVLLMKTQDISEIGLADMLGKSTQYIKNYLRLLTLDIQVQDRLLRKELTESQARYLTALDPAQQRDLAKKIVDKELTVKEISRIVAKLQASRHLDLPEPIQTRTLGHSLPGDYVKRALKFSESIDNSIVKCYGSQRKGKIVISWG